MSAAPLPDDLASAPLRELLSNLIDIYSPTGKEDEVVRYMEEYLVSRGLPVHRIPVDERRANLFVAEDPQACEVLFMGHCDTVPAWDLETFRSREENDWIAGLGAADMKGGCAALMAAFCACYAEYRTLGGAGLALVVGEEENGDGAEALVSRVRAPWALVAEPTAINCCSGHFGYIEIELTARGKRAHASLAGRDHNAVVSLLRALTDFVGYLEKNVPQAVYNIRDVHSADAGFAVPDRCSAAIDLHVPPDAPVGTIVVSIEEFFQSRSASAGNPVTCDFLLVHHGYRLPSHAFLPELIGTVFHEQSRTIHTTDFPSHSDANVLWAAGIKPVVLGPGTLARAHTADEGVSFDEVYAAACIYRGLLDQLNKAAHT